MGTRRRAMIVTGEASGDLHGAHLVQASRRIDPALEYFGVGGRRMAEAGCDILFSGDELAVVGLVEVIGHFPAIYRTFSRLKAILHGPERPDLLILIDFPEFNLRLARQAQRAGVPVLYYVSPQVWAWRRGRVKKIARVVDRLAAIFPFEPDFYKEQDIQVEYVGNPLLDEVRDTRPRREVMEEYRLDPDKPVVGLFPGSRRNELKYIFPTILDAARKIRAERPDTQFLIPVAPTLNRENLQALVDETGLQAVLVEGNIYEVASACEAIITVSGTVTLQVALVGTPMAILYKMAPLTHAVGKRLIKVPHIGLANIVAGRGVVKEFIQDEAEAGPVSREILRILEDPDYSRQIRRGLSEIQQRMGTPGCSEKVARMASEMTRKTDQERPNG